MLTRTLSTLFVLSSPLLAQNGNRAGHDNMKPVVPTEMIPASPVLSPGDALKTFEVAEGFSMLPFATEPMIEKPVALDYDPAGRLWVCEMRGYMLNIDGKDEDKPIGRITVLEDTNHDGKADKSTIFLDNILLPRAIAVYPDGVLFADEHELRFIKREGMKPVGNADIAVPKFIEAGNVEHRANGLVRGFDNWLYNAKSAKRIKRNGDKWIVENTPFRGQWGIAFDNYGRIYHNHNSQFLFGDFIAPNVLEGNHSVDTKVATTYGLGSNKPFPIRVTPGVNRAYMQKSNGYDSDTLDPKTFKLTSCTAAAGMAVYRGTNFPADWIGHGLVGESSINLVRAISVSEKDNKLVGENAYKDKEWIASTDERFRPVNLYNAPDGSVYILDMYHGIIQHKTFLTTYLREQYVSRGLDGPGVGQGRIYRVSYKGGKVESVPDMDKLSNAELVKLLAHPNGWHRDMAQRVLGTREADPATVVLLEKLAALEKFPLGQIHALWTMENMGKLTAAPISEALKSSDQKVVAAALWASTTLTHPEQLKLETQLLALKPANDEVAVYLTRALGSIATEKAFEKINELVSGSKLKTVKAAAFSGLENRGLAFKTVLGEKLKDKDLIGWIDKASTKKMASAGSSFKGEELASFNRGKAMFHGEAACFGCHGPDGSGVLNLGPPLDGSEWVTGKEDIFARILLHGLTGKITVAGTEYETPAEMPALFVNPVFTDEKIADIMTYVRNEWSNKAAPVKSDLVKTLRKSTADRSGRPYTATDLK